MGLSSWSHLSVGMLMKSTNCLLKALQIYFMKLQLENISNISIYPVNVVYGHPLVSNGNGKTKKDDKDVDYKSP